MKKLFLLLVALVSATMSFAQSTLVATLTHGEKITMYYGNYALRDAYNASVSGDVINLSGGAFQAVDIKKAVTVRGTGIDVQDPTYIINEFEINIPTADTKRFSMEGIRCTQNVRIDGQFANPYFVKCEFVSIQVLNWNSIIKNATFINCKITGEFNSYETNVNSTKQFINCFIGWFNNNSMNNSASFINCVIKDPDYTQNSQFVNCILYTIEYPNTSIHSTSTAKNCVAVKYTNFFKDSPATSGCKTANFGDVFKTFKGSYSDSETFELTDAAKTKYLGTDGTQVGIYGGLLPYTSTPSYPQITKMNVANKTTADGKLSVEIEVSAAE